MITLSAEPRFETRKKAKTIRRAGFLPAVVYGRKVAAQPIRVRLLDFEKAYAVAGESGIIILRIGDRPENPQDINVLVYSLTRHPLTNVPIHADFYAVEMDKPVRTEITIAFAGESPAVKNLGAMLIRALQHIEVEALPQNLPHSLTADCARLADINEKIFVKDIPVPPDVKVITDPDIVVAFVEMPKAEEVAPAAAPEVAEVKTERELKQAEKAKEKVAETVETDAKKPS